MNIFANNIANGKFAKYRFIKNLFFVFFSIALLYFAMFYFGFLIWIAYVPIFFLAYKNTFKKKLFFGFLFSILIALLAVYYVKYFDIKYFFVSFIYVGSFSALYVFFLSLLFEKIKYPFVIMAPPFLYLLILFLFSFNTIGSYAFNLAFCQPSLYPLVYTIKSYGVLFLIVFVNSIIAFCFIYKAKKLIACLCVLVLLITCFSVYSNQKIISGEKIRVAVIQGNFSKEWEWRSSHAKNIVFDTYERLTIETSKYKPDLIVWPEYAIPEDILVHKDLYDNISNLAKTMDVTLVFGSFRNSERTDDKMNYVYNTAYVFSPDGSLQGSYDSKKPFPFKNWVIPGSKSPIFTVKDKKFGITLCWEEYQKNIYRNYMKSGVQFFVSMVNDDPIGNLKAMYAKSQNARLNAAENKRYLIRAANTGFTEIINPYGKIIAQIEPSKEGFLVADIYIE